MTITPGFGAVLPVVEFVPPTSRDQMDMRLLQAIERLVPQSGIEQVDTNLSQLSSESIMQIDVSSLLTDSHVPLALASRKLTVLSWPACLHRLDIRINRETAQRIDILNEGRIFERSQGIAQIFVTTAPAVLGGLIRILVGDLLVHTRPRSNLAPLVFEPRQGQGIAVNLATHTLDGPKRFTFQDTRSGGANLVNDIPQGAAIRIYGTVASEDPAVIGSIPEHSLELMSDNNSAWEQSFNWPIGGPWVFDFDTGWVCTAESNDNNFFRSQNVAVGPAGNLFTINGTVDIIPAR